MNTVRENHFYYTYVLQSIANTSWYIGYSSDLQKRFKEHQEKKSTYTKSRGPYRLIYYESSLSEFDAKAREKYLKSGMGRRYLKNRLKHFLSLTV